MPSGHEVSLSFRTLYHLAQWKKWNFHSWLQLYQPQQIYEPNDAQQWSDEIH